MKAMLVDQNGAFNWTDVPDPVIKDDEVLVKIYAAGVNRADLLQRQGKYPSPPGCPEWMGLEVSGIVQTCGNAVTKWKAGDQVCALLGGGGYAEYVAVKQDMLLPVPKGLSMEEAASLPEAYATSYLNLVMEGHLEAGQTAFIPAGASGLASVAIPMAKALGARVITSVRHAHQVDLIKPLGADVIIYTAEQKVEDVLAQEEACGTPVRVVMDCLCGETLGKCLPYMAQGGYWIVISTLAGEHTDVPLRPFMKKGLHLVGSTLRSRPQEYKAFLMAQLAEKLWPLIENGDIKPSIHAVLPMSSVEDAHSILAKGENIGKVVLRIE